MEDIETQKPDQIDSNKSQKSKSKEYSFSIIRFIKEFSFVLVVALIFNFVVKTFLLGNYVVDGASMEPTFHTKDMLFIDELSYRFKDPQRGDIIVFNPPIPDSNAPYIKRIICLPGETCKVEDGKVSVCDENGENCSELNEDYLPKNTVTTGNDTTFVEEEKYYVLGDNRDASSDSRYFGSVEKEDIIGKLLVKYWPIKN